MDELLARPAPRRSTGQRLREWVEWFGVGRLGAIAVSVALVGAGGYWLVAPPRVPVEASLPMTAGAPTAQSASAPTSVSAGDVAASAITTTAELPVGIVVHVAGAVQAPGIHRLPAAARVADAVLAAGGLADDAHPDAINLAAPLRDGDRVYVPRVSDAVAVPVGVTGPTGGPGGMNGEAAGPVSINTATIVELDALPGVGPATAAAIVAHREQFGPFSSIDGLADVRGIGPAKLDALRALISL